MISTRSLRVLYKQSGVEALSGVEVDIPEKAVTCIVGPNASGKTTLLKSIAQLVDYEGVVLVEGLNARRVTKWLRKVLSYAPSTLALGDYLAVRVLDVLLASRYPVSKGFADRREDLEEVAKVAELVGISHLLDRRLGELSSGELQRVLLAAALAKKPRILLLDEPDGHLDAASKAWLSTLLHKLSSYTTIVLSTHDVLFASTTCSYVVVLSHGKLVYQGFFENLLENPKPLEEAYGLCFIRASIGDRLVLVPVYSAEPSCRATSGSS